MWRRLDLMPMKVYMHPVSISRTPAMPNAGVIVGVIGRRFGVKVARLENVSFVSQD